MTTRDDLKRNKPAQEEEDAVEEAVSAGRIDKLTDLAFNPTKEKIREMTIIDRVQGRLLPLVDLIDYMRHDCIERAYYRQNSELYKKLFERDHPLPLEPLGEFTYRMAQWQKSVQGKNLERATDIALAETEARTGEEEGLAGSAEWRE